MKKTTIKKIIDLVLTYMSIKGLSEDGMKEDNPMVIYFITAILTRNYNIPRILFYDIMGEATKIYKQLDNIVNNQNPIIKEYLLSMYGSNFDYDSYIMEIIEQYKTTLFKLLKIYKTKNVWFNKMKIDMFEDKMWEYANNEDYENAAKLRERIDKLKIVIEEKLKEEQRQNEEGEI